MPKGLKTLGLVLLAVAALVAAAVFLTPPAYRLLLARGWIDADEFLKVLRRLLLIPGLLALFAWLRPWRDGGPRTYGLLGAAARPRFFALAWGTTVVVALAILAAHFATGWLAWEDPLDLGSGFRRVLRWVPLGFLLALIEEWFFRGWMDLRLRRRVSARWTALLVAAIYAAVHAFKPSRLDIDIPYTAAGAWEGLCWWLGHLVDPLRFGPTFVGLFLFSLLLTALWRRTKTLWTPIGIHAAGLAVLRSYGGFTERDPERTWAGTKELFDGPPVWALLLVLLFWVSRPARGTPADEGGLKEGAAPQPEGG